MNNNDDEAINTNELLFTAICDNQRYDVHQWFEKYHNEHTFFPNWSPVHEAAINGHTEILWDLIHRYSFNANDDYELESNYEEIYGTGQELKSSHHYCRGSALTLALSNGHMATAEFLIRSGADVNATYYDDGGNNDDNDMQHFFGITTPPDEGNCLLQAFDNDAPSIIQLLVDHGLEVDYGWGRNGENPFTVFMRSGNAQNVTKLLKIGADPDQMVEDDDDDWNPLYFAVNQYLGSEDEKWLRIIESLLEYGASLSYREDRGNDDTVLEIVLRSDNRVLAEKFGLERAMT